MNNKFLKFGSATIIATFLIKPVSYSIGEAKVSTMQNSNNQMTADEYIKYK